MAASTPTETRDLQLYTAREVARLLRANPWDVRALAREGVLPCVRIGRRVRFRHSDLERFLEERRAQRRLAGETR